MKKIKQASGILVISPKVERILLLERSSNVKSPGLWSISGGSKNKDDFYEESYLLTAIRESKEEMGRIPAGKINYLPIDYYDIKNNLFYRTFILEVEPKETINFKPQLNWEHLSYEWPKYEEISLFNLHPGLKYTLNLFLKNNLQTNL